MRYSFCKRCGKKKVDGAKCTCKPEQSVKRKEYQKKYYYENDRELGTSQWREKRKEILQRDFCCQRCLILYQEVSTFRLQVHHIKPRSNKNYKHLIFEDTNLITLCEPCNKFYNGNDPLTGKQWERLDFEWQPPSEDRLYFL